MDTKDKHVFYDKLTYVYLEMPKFKKTEDELVSMYDKWLFVLKNLARLMERPAALQERIFTRLFEQAEIARFTPEESRIYEESLKHYRDLRNVVNSAKRSGIEQGWAEGRAKGREEGRVEGRLEGHANADREHAIKMKAKGFALEDIADITGLTIEEIAAL